MANVFQRLVESANEDTDPKWLEEQMRTPAALVSSVDIGSLYLFQYDPKYADKLPYYDTQPLVVPFDNIKNGFRGLNFHYIAPRFRAILMDELFQLSTDRELTAKTKLNLSYQLLQQVSSSKYYKPCIKNYLYTNVRSRYVLVNPEQWMKALLLPLARFQKANVNTVYANSNRNL